MPMLLILNYCTVLYSYCTVAVAQYNSTGTGTVPVALVPHTAQEAQTKPGAWWEAE
jgi:hypothetical protein